MTYNKFTIIGAVSNVEERYTKENQLYWILRVEDGMNTFDIPTYDNKASQAKTGDMITVEGYVKSKVVKKDNGQEYTQVSLFGSYVKLDTI